MASRVPLYSQHRTHHDFNCRLQMMVLLLTLMTGEPVAKATALQDLSGTWLFRGIEGQNCTITQTGNRLHLVTERGDQGNGRFVNATTIVVDFPFARGLRGTITEGGNRIQWSNGEFWVRADSSTGQPKNGWYVSKDQDSRTLSLRLEKRGNYYQVTGEFSTSAATYRISGAYYPRTYRLAAKWRQPVSKARSIEQPIDGKYDPDNDAFEVGVMINIGMGRAPLKFDCTRN